MTDRPTPMEAGSVMGVDIGGTFTDVATIGRDGRLHIGKVLTTPGEEESGVVTAIQRGGADPGEIDLLIHGTTMVINALLERRGARTALLTTSGFRDMLEIGRGNRGHNFDPFYRRLPPLVNRELRFEVEERTLGDGTVQTPVDPVELARIYELVKDSGAEAVAVAFLNSYLNPHNELAVQDYLAPRLPGVFVTTSSSLSREWREYERASSAAANAYVGPALRRYLVTIQQRIEALGFSGRIVMLDSNGGALPAGTAQQYPVRLVESGPVGGVIGARDLARKLGLSQVVTFDMGGTTAKSCVLGSSGMYESADLYWIGGEAHGFPIQVPTIDIIEIGAGGGSVAWHDEGGRLRVGPHSAGSKPGPASYGFGGTEPTITDANVFCGLLAPEHFIADLRLRPDLAEDAIGSLARDLHLEPLRLAKGIRSLANMSMAALVRRQTVERGRDPGDFSLVAFGGAGPLHACEVAQEVGIRQVVVPEHPGHFSALGMLAANMEFDVSTTFTATLSTLDDPSRLGSTLRELATTLARQLELDPSDDRGVAFSFLCRLRYQGQDHSLVVANPDKGLDVGPGSAARFGELFEAEYVRRFGHRSEKADVELVGVTVRGTVDLAPATADPTGATVASGPAKTWRRHTYLGATGERVPTVVTPRESLPAGVALDGPAIVYEVGAVVAIPEGWSALPDPATGALVLTHKPEDNVRMPQDARTD